MTEKKKTAAGTRNIGDGNINIHESIVTQATEKIKCVVQKPGYFSEIAEIDNTLESFQRVVGGHIETLNLPPYDLILVMNEEGKLKDLEPNIEIGGSDIIVGSVIVTAADEEGNFRSLTVSEIQIACVWLFQRQILRKDRRK